jgi:hypothetical protein
VLDARFPKMKERSGELYPVTGHDLLRLVVRQQMARQMFWAVNRATV